MFYQFRSAIGDSSKMTCVHFTQIKSVPAENVAAIERQNLGTEN